MVGRAAQSQYIEACCLTEGQLVSLYGNQTLAIHMARGDTQHYTNEGGVGDKRCPSPRGPQDYSIAHPTPCLPHALP